MLKGAFMDEEGTLGGRAITAGKPAKSATAGDHPVARDEYWYGIGTAGPADGSGHGAQNLRELAIASGLAVGNAAHLVPNAFLEGCTGRREREIEVALASFGIGFKLARGVLQKGALIMIARTPGEADDDTGIFGDAKCPQGGFYRGLAHHAPLQSFGPAPPRPFARASCSAAAVTMGNEQLVPRQR